MFDLLWHSLQNTTDVITKCDSYFITKCNRSLLKNASGFLLQNATVIIKRDDCIAKCGSYYNMRRLLQIATVRTTLQFDKWNWKRRKYRWDTPSSQFLKRELGAALHIYSITSLDILENFHENIVYYFFSYSASGCLLSNNFPWPFSFYIWYGINSIQCSQFC